jgi:glycine/D-amino acid oxidase-like deaminating enzyme
VEIDTWWTGILGLGPVKKPIVEKFSPNVVVAVRLSGMGVAIGTLVGQEGAILLAG